VFSIFRVFVIGFFHFAKILFAIIPRLEMIIHIDMDAFYASVEQLDRPELKGKCVIVGGTSRRGVVSAASYEARKYGVHSAMPIFQAQKKCPNGIFIPPRMSRYKDVSAKVMSILKRYSPLVEVVSIDEAYLDVSGCERIHGTPETIAANVKNTIRRELELTCSVGVAPVRFLAKIASDMNKPDGMAVIQPDSMEEFIDRLPVHKVPGVGKLSRKNLNHIGIYMLGDVNKYPAEMITKRFGKFGQRLIHLAKGIDKTPVSPNSVHKSVSTERTLAEDTLDIPRLKKVLLKQSETVGRELRKMNQWAKTITLKIKHDNFRLVTRRVTIANPTQSSEIIYKKASMLLDQYRLSQKVRLIGVGASAFTSAVNPVQMDMFESRTDKGGNWEKVDRAIDGIDQKYGKDTVKRATLAPKIKD
jgi:DNA polymerase-4